MTLTRAQYPAMVGNTENTKPLAYAGIASPCDARLPSSQHSQRDEVSGSSPLIGSYFRDVL